MINFAEKKCKPCEGGTLPLIAEQAEEYLKTLPEEWRVLGGNKISKEFVLKDFVKAIAFVDRIADVAESEGHHPDIFIRYNKVEITLWTHAIGGLSENDFIVAAKIEQMSAAAFL